MKRRDETEERRMVSEHRREQIQVRRRPKVSMRWDAKGI